MRTIAGTLLTVLSCAFAQTDASLQFEAASIKPAPPPDLRGMRVSQRGGPGSDDPGLFNCENCEVAGLIELAFDIQSYQLSGPDSMHSARFNVSARIAPGTTPEQFRAMLLNLLVERFQLKFHRDQKEMPVLNLVVAKNGPKFKESKPVVEQPRSEEDAPPKPAPTQKDANGFPVIPRGGKGLSMMMTQNRAALRSDEATMRALAATLSGQLRQPVLDATGLTGKYEIAMIWVPGDSPDNPGPTIFAALQEQLGLKLESKKSMIGVVVVDHLEKTPTEN